MIIITVNHFNRSRILSYQPLKLFLLFTDCPIGFEYLSAAKGCYKISESSLTWNAAQTQCNQLKPGARLAIIQNKEQHDAVAERLKKTSLFYYHNY